jgi:hypothetical protein
MKAMRKEILPKGRITVKKKKHGKTLLKYYPVPGRGIADIEIGTAANKKRYFSLGLYPSRFRPGEFERFKELLNIFLEPFNYTKLYKTANVSYLELAADSISIPMFSFMPFRAKTNESYVYQLPEGDGGIYLGAGTGRLRFCVYNKARQIVQKLKEKSEYPVRTRIEARMHSLGVPAEKLCELANPFPKLEIADMEVLEALCDQPESEAFLKQCSAVGACKALSGYGAKERRQFLALLRKARASWWNPESRWNHFGGSLAVITP